MTGRQATTLARMAASSGVPKDVLRFDVLKPAEGHRAGPADIPGLPSDVQLLALAREDRGQALELLYGAYKGRIYSFLMRLVGDPDTADDVTQETFTKAFRALDGLAQDHRILPWLYRIASNSAIDHLRRGRRFTWLRMGKLEGTGLEPRMADEHGRVPEREHMQAVLRALPPENAIALLLHAVEGYSYAEIAEIQGCSMTAVRSRIARARSGFRERYEAK